MHGFHSWIGAKILLKLNRVYVLSDFIFLSNFIKKYGIQVIK